MATTASTSGVRTPSALSDSDPAWREDLAAYLRPQMFPAGQDELQATLLRLHAPSRLLGDLLRLPYAAVRQSGHGDRGSGPAIRDAPRP